MDQYLHQIKISEMRHIYPQASWLYRILGRLIILVIGGVKVQREEVEVA